MHEGAIRFGLALVVLGIVAPVLRRLRDSIFPELVILLLIVAHTDLSFSRLVDATPWLATATATGLRVNSGGLVCGFDKCNSLPISVVAESVEVAVGAKGLLTDVRATSHRVLMLT